MSDDAAPAPKKKGKKKLIILVVGGLVLVGGGVAGGMFAAGMGLGGAHAGAHVDPDAPKLVLRAGQQDALERPGEFLSIVGPAVEQ